jgi:hypothetical protein
MYVLVIHIPAEGVELFQRYEAAVLPLLSAHGGSMERRLPSRARVELYELSDTS